MKGLLSLSTLIDRINEVIGKAMGYAILLAVVVSAVNAVIRKVFSNSSNAWLELQWYLYGARLHAGSGLYAQAQ
jgi:TRAP-type mannitol/chloroaromatic compound transport system permease small subunit